MSISSVNKISLKYREQFLKRQEMFRTQYEKLFTKVADDVANLANDPAAKFTKAYNFNNNIHKKIDVIIDKFQTKFEALTQNEIAGAWLTSAAKNNEIVYDYYKNTIKNISQDLKALYNPNLDALRAFTSRANGTETLSDRVWNIANQYRAELEVHLGMGIMNGDSAGVISRRVRKYLKEPDALFRRVRDKNGKLVASQAMKDHKPGRGVYNSAYKNAMRLTRTETNQAYLLSDSLKWGQLPMVTGIKIAISSQHHIYDICDVMQGEYPKDYVFTGWHVQCLCHAVPVLMPRDEFIDYLKGSDELKIRTGLKTLTTPKMFDWYVQKNMPTLPRLPRWAEENPKYTRVINSGEILTEMSKVAGDEVQAFAQDLARDFNGIVSNLSLKSAESAARKVRDEYQGDNNYWQIKDGARNTILLPSQTDIQDAVRILKYDDRVIRIKNVLPGDDPMGYTGVLMNFRAANGLVCEVQMNTAEMLFAKQGDISGMFGDTGKFLYKNLQKRFEGIDGGLGHKFYEEKRLLDGKLKNDSALSETEKSAIKKQIADIDKKSRDYYKIFYEETQYRVSSADELVRLARESAKEVDKMAKDIAKQFNGEASALNFKSLKSIERKVAIELGGRYSEVNDAVRNLVILKKDELQKALTELANKEKFPRILEVDNVRWGEDSMGYTGGAIYYRTGNGLMVETQLLTAEMIYAKEIESVAIEFLGRERYEAIKRATGLPSGLGHKYYEEKRVLPKSAVERRLELDKISTEYYSHFQQDVIVESVPKTIPEAVSRLNRMGFMIEGGPGDMPLEMLVDIINSLDRFKDFTHGTKIIKLTDVTTDKNMTHGTYAYCETKGQTSTLFFNKEYFEKYNYFKESAKKSELSGWHPRETGNPEAVVTHEMGHALSVHDIESNLEYRKKVMSIYQRYLNENNKLIDGLPQSLDGYYRAHGNYISEYAEQNLKEFVAEAFAMAIHSNAPSSYAIEIYNLIKETRLKATVKETAVEAVSASKAKPILSFSRAKSILDSETLLDGSLKFVAEEDMGTILSKFKRPNVAKFIDNFGKITDPTEKGNLIVNLLGGEITARTRESIVVQLRFFSEETKGAVWREVKISTTATEPYWESTLGISRLVLPTNAKSAELFGWFMERGLTLDDRQIIKMSSIDRGETRSMYELLIRTGKISYEDVIDILESAAVPIPDRLKELPSILKKEQKGLDKLADKKRKFITINVSDSYKEAYDYLNKAALDFIAQRESASVSDITSRLNKEVQTNLMNVKVVIRAESGVLEDILEDGRFKSQFETNTSNGALNTSLRSGIEHDLFTYDVNLNPKERPIYGMLTRSIDETGGVHYGDLIFELKDRVKTRTTWTQGDSLDATGCGTFPAFKPTPVNNPTYESIYFSDCIALEDVIKRTPIRTSKSFGYTEAQIHGGVKVSDIEKVWLTDRVSEREAEGIIKSLESKKIKWGRTNAH